MKKIDFFGPIEGEAGVIMAFAKIHESLGFRKIVSSKSRGLDIPSIEYNGQEVTVEFEHKSSNFILHQHQNEMTNGKKYVVICWEDDCGLNSKLNNEHGKKLFNIIEMRNYVNIKTDLPYSDSQEEPKYVVLSYNPRLAERDFGEWACSHCYRVSTSKKTKKFSEDKLPARSKILFYRNNFIIGSCTVVRYEIIERPRTKREWMLYTKLTNYPASLYDVTIEEWKQGEWLRGHIFYTDFVDRRDFKIRFTRFVKKKMPRQGKMNLTKEQYFRIIGK